MSQSSYVVYEAGCVRCCCCAITRVYPAIMKLIRLGLMKAVLNVNKILISQIDKRETTQLRGEHK